MNSLLLGSATVNHLTHMMYLPSRDHWIEVSPLPDLYGLGEMLEFKNGHDAALWILEPEQESPVK